MRKNITTGIVLIVLFIIGAVVFYVQKQDQIVHETSSQEEGVAVRELVTQFGNKLKNTSLLQPKESLKTQLQEQYGSYLTPELLAKWQTNPQIALGRQTSSPWPDHIEITAVIQQESNIYKVEGNVIEITSADKPGEFTASYPITLTIKETTSGWRISEVVKGSYNQAQ